MTELRQGQHYNDYLQHAWHQYGESQFCWSVLEIVEDLSLLLEREQYWIDRTGSHQKTIGFNLCPESNSCRGLKRKTPTRRPKPYVVVNPEGQETIVLNLPQFCRETGLEYPSMFRVSKGRWSQHKGWSCRPLKVSASDWKAKVASQAKVPGAAKAKDYILIDPDGIEHRVRNLKQFCKARSFSAGTMTMVISGLRHHHHGWTCRRVTEEDNASSAPKC